jgi:hypothetical protein
MGVTTQEKVQDVYLAGGEIVPGGDGWQQLIGGGRLQDDGHVPAAERAGGKAEPAAGFGANSCELVGARALSISRPAVATCRTV